MSRITGSRRAVSLLVLPLLAAFVPTSARAQTGPIPAPIPRGTVRVDLQPVASGLVSPIDLRPEPGDATKLFVTDQAGQVRVIQNGILQTTPFLDVSNRLVSLTPGYDERGFLGFAFSPDFNNPGTPGFGKVYTYTSEPPTGTADFTVPISPPNTFNNQGVIAEWKVSSGNPNVIDPTSRREILRMDHPQFNHDGGPIMFGPDKNLYIGIGDGGNANDVGAGHNPTTGNAQDLTTVMGKILRIDPTGTAVRGKYSIPQGNPFASGSGSLPEIYAYGFRNPYRFSFDSASGSLLVADVGQNNVEEVDRVTAGGNYGWHFKEGTFKFDPATGNVSSDTSGLPAGLIDPLIQYDHDEGIAIVGGFVYHGTKIPGLDGKYVFGDFSKSFQSPTGRLFYADLSTGQISEFHLGGQDLPLGLFVKGMGEDANGELYVLGTTVLGPTGTSGQVFLLTPEPSGLLAAAAFAACLALRRRRAGPASRA